MCFQIFLKDNFNICIIEDDKIYFNFFIVQSPEADKRWGRVAHCFPNLEKKIYR